MKNKHNDDPIIANNKKAYHDYTVLEKFEAGIRLNGTEVKSCRARTVTMQDSYVNFVGKYCAKLVNAHIAQYENGNIFNHEPKRQRQLLMHRNEILKLKQQSSEKGLTIIPLKMYFKGSLIKIQIGLCKGKIHADKRDAMKQKQDLLETQRAIRDRK